jgi:RNA polymerase sigma factor (sigma-70 family)
MSDSEIVASIVAGDPEGLAAAYDRYAGDLFGYCQSLLQDPNDAADAVQDTFVIAVSKLAGLRDPERLRAWLFAVARNECLHRLKSRHAVTPLHDAPEPVDDSVDVGGEAERAETVALLRAAVGGLNDGERDVINQLWHGLDVPEAAVVLGVSRNHAYSLFSRARDQLEASVAVLLVGRAGRADCATLDSLLRDWDGRLTALLRKRVGRHIDRCPVCSDRRRRELTPALLYGLSPAALLAVAALRKISVLTGATRGGPPSGVRDTVLHLATDPASHATAYAQVTGRSTQSFGGNGFPRPPHHGFLGVAPRPHMPFTVVGGTAVAAAATVVVTVVVPHMQPAHRPSGGGLTLGAPVPGGLAPAGASRSGPSSGTPATGPGTRGAATQGPPASGTPLIAPASGGGTAGPTNPATATGPGMPATVTAAAPAAPAGTQTDGPLSAGTLSVSPTTVLLSPLLGGSLTLTASGGPVSWSISEPASLLGELTVAPASGTLSAGGSVTVAITVSGLVSLDTQLTVQPGGQAVTVVLGLG